MSQSYRFYQIVYTDFKAEPQSPHPPGLAPVWATFLMALPVFCLNK